MEYQIINSLPLILKFLRCFHLFNAEKVSSLYCTDNANDGFVYGLSILFHTDNSNG